MHSAAGTWDATTQRLVAYAQRAQFGALSARSVHEIKRHLIDTFASALGAFDEEVSVMARAVASFALPADVETRMRIGRSG